MLTKDDLLAIQNLIRIENKTSEKRLEVKLKKYFKEEIRKVINFFDKEVLDLKNRVKRIEDYLGLPSIN
jgi:predicted  nucleic acid-binding Zn-ribbon protein